MTKEELELSLEEPSYEELSYAFVVLSKAFYSSCNRLEESEWTHPDSNKLMTTSEWIQYFLDEAAADLEADYQAPSEMN